MKVAKRDKRKRGRAKPKIEIHADGMPVKRKAGSKPENRAWRQRGPTAIIIAIPPGYPGRSPYRIRSPAPSQVRMLKPTPIMERSPTPGIFREPVPPTVGAQPAAAVAIGAPVGISNGDRRLPTTSIPADIDPITVRRQVIIETRGLVIIFPSRRGRRILSGIIHGGEGRG